MFQKLKQKLIKEEQISTYLKYAIGEIILIVFGILIAVSINNWNQENQKRELKNGIFEVIANDLESDTAEVSRVLNFYKERKSTFKRVANETLSRKEVLKCTLCKYLITSRRLVKVNTRGFTQLNDYQNVTVESIDSLAFNIINFYSIMTNNVNQLNDFIDSDIMNNLKYWRDEYSWYTDFAINDTLNEEAIHYFGKSQEYKNKLAYLYIILYENYVPTLVSFQENSKEILKNINSRLDNN